MPGVASHVPDKTKDAVVQGNFAGGQPAFLATDPPDTRIRAALKSAKLELTKGVYVQPKFLSIIRGDLPRLFTYVLLLCLWFSLSVMTFVGGLVSSSSYDEPFHEQYLRDDFLNFHSWVSIRSLTPRPLDGSGNALEFLGHVLNVALGNDRWLTTVSVTPAGIMGRHAVMSFLGIYASFLVFRTTKILTNNSLSSVTAATCLLAIPMWSGSAFFNPKDTPVAFGLIGFIYVFTKLLSGGQVESPFFSLNKSVSIAGSRFFNLYSSIKLLRTFLSLFFSFEVIFFVITGVGTRPGALTLLTAFYLGLGGILLLRTKYYDLALVTLLTILGLFFSAAVNPLSYSNPITYFRDQITMSNHFSYWNGINLVAGHVMRARENRWWFEPAWILAQTPVLIEIVIVAGMSISIVKFFRLTFFKIPQINLNYQRLLDSSQLSYLPVLSLFSLPLLYAVFFHPVLYNASRHLMMIYPAIAIFFGLGVNVILQRMTKVTLKVTVFAVIALALIAPSWEGLRLFPYNYVYLNPVARLFGTNGAWDFDYWKLSLPAALKLNPSAKPLLIWPSSIPDNLPSPYWIAGWIEPNYPSIPASCKATYVTRPLGTDTINLGYMAVCIK